MSTVHPSRIKKDKCAWVLAAGKAGLIVGMLSELHREGSNCERKQDFPTFMPQTVDWREFIPLPCHCSVCYRAFENAIDQGRRHRIKTEDFTRYSSKSVIATAAVSKLNQAIVSLLPDLYPHFDSSDARKPWS